MHLFYTPLISPEMPHFILDEEESKHAIRVLRLGIGDKIYLVDGKGNFFTALIQDNHPKRVIIQIEEVKKEFGKRNYALHIAIAPTKNIERFEWFLEKATEIGIDEITPIICERSERKDVKLDRLNKIVITAMKQSIKAFKPILNEPVKFESFIEKQSQKKDVKMAIAHCVEDEKRFLNEIYKSQGSICILIGPEGDFTPNEIKLALDKGVLPISLGESRLRTETAGIAACMEINLLNRLIP